MAADHHGAQGRAFQDIGHAQAPVQAGHGRQIDHWWPRRRPQRRQIPGHPGMARRPAQERGLGWPGRGVKGRLDRREKAVQPDQGGTDIGGGDVGGHQPGHGRGPLDPVMGGTGGGTQTRQDGVRIGHGVMVPAPPSKVQSGLRPGPGGAMLAGENVRKGVRPGMTEITKTDVAIVGAGPVGLFAVFECGMLKLSCQVVDALDMIGGQCAALYPEKPIFDIPAHPRIEGAELIAKLREQTEPFDATWHLGQQVVGLERTLEDRFRLTTSQGTVIDAAAVIIAAGSGAFGPNRPPLDGLEAYEGKSVFYLVRRREDFRGQRVVIAGGGDSAVDWALSLADVADKVMVVHRRPKFRAAPESAARLAQMAEDGRVELVIPYQLAGLEGADGQLSAVVVKTLQGESRRLEADRLLPFFGLAMELGPIAEWGLNLDRHTVAVDPATMETNLPGVFAIGDVCTYPGKLKLILTGFAEAARAAHSAFGRAHPGEALHFEYSTTKGVP